MVKATVKGIASGEAWCDILTERILRYKELELALELDFYYIIVSTDVIYLQYSKWHVDKG